jgi:hypothetical protein
MLSKNQKGRKLFKNPLDRVGVKKTKGNAHAVEKLLLDISRLHRKEEKL